MDYHTGSAKPVFCLWLGFQSHTLRDNDGDARKGMRPSILMDAHLHFDDSSGRRMHQLVFVYRLPSCVTANTLVQHSITYYFRTVLLFIFFGPTHYYGEVPQHPSLLTTSA
jgi:hypothetical protein